MVTKRELEKLAREAFPRGGAVFVTLTGRYAEAHRDTAWMYGAQSVACSGTAAKKRLAEALRGIIAEKGK